MMRLDCASVSPWETSTLALPRPGAMATMSASQAVEAGVVAASVRVM
ncbi:unannotated protein [freshwater metagenome]|uniref:Unannotated protein n=1 Tax=freshwater metagenome TaxID=449393 RepID=A0A6J7DFQ3_9ZZZZ